MKARHKEGTKIVEQRRAWLNALADSDISDEEFEKETAGLCSDCLAKPGEEHAFGCDQEYCSDCGRQYITCDCNFRAVPRLPHSVERHGFMECREFGWVLNFKLVEGEDGEIVEVDCDKDDPDAFPDLNRLLRKEAVWSKEKKRFVLFEDATPEDIRRTYRGRY